MKTNRVLAIISRLAALRPLLFRLQNPASPFFRPLLAVVPWLAVLSVGLIALKDHLGEAGLNVPGWLLLASEIVSIASGTAWLLASLTLDEASLAKLKELTQPRSDEPV